jgi:hypothetical protein
MDRDLLRIRRVTANYFFWQGLRWVPLGLPLLLLGVADLTGRPLPGAWGDLGLPAAVALAAAVSWALGGYYRRTFGRVQDDPGAHALRDLLKWCVVYPAMFASLVVDVAYSPAAYLTGPVWGAGILAYWWSTGRGRPHYPVAALAMASLSLVQAGGLVAPGRPMFGLFATLLGTIYIVGGLLDHLELRRVLRPARE